MRFATEDGVIFEVDRAHRRVRRIRGKEHGIHTRLGEWREYAWITSFNPFSPDACMGEVVIDPGFSVQIMWNHMINGTPHATTTAPVIMVSLEKKRRATPLPLPKGIEPGPYHAT